MKSAGLTLLKISLAVVLFLYVLGQIETRDLLLKPGPSGAEAVRHPGRLEGDWQAGEWHFVQASDGLVVLPGDLQEGWEVRPGFFTLLRGIRLSLYAMGIACWTLLVLVVTWRWRILLRAAGVESSYLKALRLSFIGYFFNNAMPGLTGGDLVRAVLVTRGLEARRARAAMSVLVDRLLGLFSLLLLAGIMLLFHRREAAGPEHLDTVRRGVFLILGIAAAGAAVYLSRRARRALRLDALLARLPAARMIGKVDEAITVYRSHPGTVVAALLLSMILQAFGILSFWAVARSLGAGLSVADDFIIFPVVQTVSSVPISPAGWGIGEGLYGKFFEWFGSTFTLGVAASILFRLTTQMGFGLVGGLVWVLSRERGQDIRAIAAESPEALP